MNAKSINNSLSYRISAIFMIVMLMLASMPVTSTQAAPLKAVGVGTDFGTASVAQGNGAMTAITGTYTVGAGTNRVLIVAVLWESQGNGQTTSFTSGSYGGQALTSLTLNGSNATRNRVWVGYLKEVGIAAAASTTLNLNFANSVNPNGWVVKAAWFNGIDQTTPINNFVNGGNENPGSATHNFGGNLAVINGGRAIYFESTNQDITYTAPAGYTENFDANYATNNFRGTAGFKPITANGNENPNIVQSGAQRYRVTAISLNPAPTAPVAPAFTSGAATTFTVGATNTFTVAASGNPAPTFSFTGALPAGVTLNAAGVLSGTPAAGTVGTYPIVITATGTPPNATQNFTLTVQKANTTTTINSDTPDPSLVGQNVVVNYTVASAGNTIARTGNVTVGDGVNTCVGTVTGAGTGTCTLALTTGGSRPLTATYAGDANFNGSTSAAAAHTVNTPVAPSITSANNATFTVGIAGTFTVATTGYPVPTFAVSGVLPTGVTLSVAGVLSGTPAAGTAGIYPVTITASNGVLPNATQNFTLTVVAPTPACSGSLAYTAPAGTNRVVVVVASAETVTISNVQIGGVAATTISYVQNGGVPYDTQIHASYRVIGTSAVPQAMNITTTGATCIYATTYQNINQTTGTGVANTINSIATATAPSGTTTTTTNVFNAVGGAVNNAAGGQVVYAISMNNPTSTGVDGQVSTGTSTAWTFTELLDKYEIVAFNRTAVGQSTTTAAGSATVSVGDGGVAHNRSALVAFSLNPVAPTITSPAPAGGTEGTAYSHTYTATGTTPITFSYTGTLPPGLTLTPAGVLSGTPTAAGTYTGIVTATNGVAPNATQAFSITIAAIAPTITSAAPSNGVQGIAYSHTYTANGTAPITFSAIPGSLPPGLTLTSAGILSGTPTTIGTYSGVVTATNGVSPDATQSFSITISMAPAITSANSTSFTLGTAGSFTVATTGFPLPTLSMTGALPSGVTFTPATGVLAGTPATGTSGTYPLTFTATNGVSPDAVQNFTLIVSQGPSITSANTTTFSVKLPGTFTVTAIGVPAPTLSMTGTLPGGVTFTPATGVLAGTPDVGTAGVYPLTFNAVNGTSPDASQSFTLTIKNGPVIVPNGINSVPDTGNGSISNNEVIAPTLNITKLIVKFDQDVYNVPSGDPNFAKSVVNPANYMLVLGSSDGAFATLSCAGGVVSPDVARTADSVTYSNGGGAGPFVATLNFTTLPINTVGYYQLYVCGTTSIADATDINLELAGDGITPGTDFRIGFRIRTSGGSGGGNGGGNTNRPANTDLANTALIPVTGFAPNKVTALPAQPANKAYASMDGIRIEIPTLGIKYPIVGVMFNKNNWDLTWLKDSVAYLEGSAYPTLTGNTVLTAHVVDANDNLGPFSDIKGLKSGQKIYIHAYGQVYVYQVQENRLLLPSSVKTVFKHEEEYSLITLVTCEDFNEKTGLYNFRRMVRAVLVSVVPEKK